MGRMVMEPPPPPVSLGEVKAYLRIEGSEEDALLAGLVRGAAGMCEAFTRLALVERTVIEQVPATGAWTRLGAAPVRAIHEVERLAPDGSAAPLPSRQYAIDIDAQGDGWVRAADAEAKSVQVTYQAGLARDWNGVPEALRQGVVRLAAHLHAHRDAAGDAGPPAAVTALWRPWRRIRL